MGLCGTDLFTSKLLAVRKIKEKQNQTKLNVGFYLGRIEAIPSTAHLV